MSRKIIWRIIEAFKREVEEERGRFVIVHLPTKKPLQRLMNGKPLKYQNLLEELDTNFEVIDPSPKFLQQAKGSSVDDMFSTNQGPHYSKVGYQIVGETVANGLLAQ